MVDPSPAGANSPTTKGRFAPYAARIRPIMLVEDARRELHVCRTSTIGAGKVRLPGVPWRSPPKAAAGAVTGQRRCEVAIRQITP